MTIDEAALAAWLRLADFADAGLSRQDVARVASYVSVRRVEKGSALLVPGEVCHVQGLVTRGCLRVYFSEVDGSERVLYFAPEGWWVTDVESLLLEHPTSLAIDAMESSDLLLIDEPALWHLREEVPGCERLFRTVARRTLVRMQRRLVGSLRKSAEERYLEFRALYPDLELRIPQYQVASYVGISAEFLSKLRRRLFGAP